ncbi:hypothetical protein GR255_22110, partial [Mycobacterium tuberculosis]|nr:hypothetical protein [Mycobacterium tuberculosis]
GYHGGASTVASQLTPWQQLLSVLPPVVTAAPAGGTRCAGGWWLGCPRGTAAGLRL